MSDEEKKALIKKLGYCELEYQQNGYLSVGKFEAIKQAINLIEKQAKEIEKLNNENIRIRATLSEVNKKWEDKIKAKIEENKWAIEHYDCDEADYKQSQAVGAWNVLQSLLEKE